MVDARRIQSRNQRENVRQELERLITEAQDPVTASDLSWATGYDRRTLYRYLNDLVESYDSPVQADKQSADEREYTSTNRQ